MTTGAALWEQFVAGAGADAIALAEATGDAVQLRALGQRAFRIALSSLLLGADDVGQLAIAIERAIERIGEPVGDAGEPAGAPGSEADAAGAPAELAAAIRALHAALHQLAHADRSGARVEGLALDDHRRALDAAEAGAVGPATFRPPGEPRAPEPALAFSPTAAQPPAAFSTSGAAAASGAGAPTGGGFAWTPAVDDDMIELFFDEASERIAALAGKLIEIERRPGDGELVRDVFRDLHTVKGSSAMVGLRPIHQLAHAAEDLVGQIRDAGRAVDGTVVDALLAALDALRDMLAEARAGRSIAIDPAPVIARLRNPGAAPPAPPAPTAADPGAAVARAAAPVADAARQTIRVDFDKLDRLLNLVGELVLGRDSLRGAVHALGSITTELATDRGVARHQAIIGAGGRAPRGLDHLGGELSRTERSEAGVGTPTAPPAGRGRSLRGIERVLADVTSDLDQGTERLDAISGELRDQVMRLRMVSVAGVFRKHVRTVRDLAAGLGKRARLELDGEDTELDKLLVEALDEPLLHLVRNAVDHGIEPPDARTAAGKPAEGVIRIAAAHRGNQVEIRVSDDGRGLDPARLRAKAVERRLVSPAEADAMDDRAARELIFRAGFSTAAQVSEVSGRGVGMDAVRQTIVARLKGTIEVQSTPGQGSAFVLKLPLTLAIIQVIIARAGGETFAIPLDVVRRVLVIQPGDVALIGDREVCVVRGQHVPLIRLDAVLELDGGGGGDGALQLILVGHTGPGAEVYALACDHLVGKREIVIKSLGPLLASAACAAGATLLGDRVALILDVPAIIRRALDATLRSGGPARPAARGRSAEPRRGAHILLVEDSDTVRESLRRLLAEDGHAVTVAVDGQHGLELARSRQFDLISTDVVMPRLDGYELTRALRATPEYADTPIIMVTSMGERIDRVRGFDAGVDEYITKPHDRALLLRTVRKLLGHGDPGDPAGGDA
ncbi:MAG TPA: response regulator [Kofleriaceae bacterium]|jgi:chemotaxis protein histidine kinase CheA/CheY-like chemotaxis protein|nr:response regulator [Kofleriaceae bacterium]